MKYLLIPVLWILSTGKLVFQSGFSKYGKCTYGDSIFFNAVMFTTVALIFFPFLITNGAKMFTLLSGITMGFFSLLFQICYIIAFSKGKTSLTVTINNFSLLVPVIVSYFLFDEKFGVLKLTGTCLILISFMLTVSREKAVKEEKLLKHQWWQWLGYTMLVFLSNGILSVNQKIYSKLTTQLEIFEYVAVAYLFASLVSWFIFMIVNKKEIYYKERKLYKKTVFLAVGAGVFLGLYQCMNTYAASVIDGIVLFPVTNCGISLILTLIGKFFFKEKLSKMQYGGVFVGTVAIVFMSI